MPHRYTCQQCLVSAPEPRDRRADAEADQKVHRDAAHGGYAPLCGDVISRVHDESRGSGFLPRHTIFAGLVLLILILANHCGH